MLFFYRQFHMICSVVVC